MRLRVVVAVAASLALAGCGSHTVKWNTARLVPTLDNPGQGPCYSALNPDRTAKRIICQGESGVGTCYDPSSGNTQSDFTIDAACGAARTAIEHAFHVHF